MSFIASFTSTAVGKKAVMAVTGVVLFGFVLGHMAGNLKLYLGPEALNHYAVFLREMGSPLFPHETLLWAARIILLTCVGLHIAAAYQLSRLSRAARGTPYQRLDHLASTYASRTMRWGGVIILLFVIYHLLHLTFGTVHADFVPGDVYHNVVAGFRVAPVSVLYILANLALGTHLYHGLFSMLQTLGCNHPKFNPWRRSFAMVFAVVVTAGNVSFPLSVLAGLVGE